MLFAVNSTKTAGGFTYWDHKDLIEFSTTIWLKIVSLFPEILTYFSKSFKSAIWSFILLGTGKFIMRKLLFLAAIAVAAGVANAQSGAADHGKVMGCYWGSWSFYRCKIATAGPWGHCPLVLWRVCTIIVVFSRPGLGKFDVSDIDATLCTHGYYGFADIDPNTYEIKERGFFVVFRLKLSMNILKCCS